MICNRIVDSGHIVNKSNSYLVDTNILLYLYGNAKVTNKNKKIEDLSKKFLSALDMKCKVFIPAVVIAEFINRFHKREYELYCVREKILKKDYKKQYRDTKLYEENNEFIMHTIRETILDRCEIISDSFENKFKEKILSINKGQDFNDVLIINIANQNNLFLISADIDTQKLIIK